MQQKGRSCSFSSDTTGNLPFTPLIYGCPVNSFLSTPLCNKQQKKMHQMITGCWILLESRSVSFVSMKNPHYSKKNRLRLSMRSNLQKDTEYSNANRLLFNFLVGSYHFNFPNLLKNPVWVTDTYHLCTNHFFHLRTQPERPRRSLISLDPVA